MNMPPAQPRVAILIFAENRQRDLRRKGFSSRFSPLLSLPALSAAGADLHWFSNNTSEIAERDVRVHRQRGRSFGQRLENAVNDLAAEGYDRVVIVGRDCPQLTSDHVSNAIQLLDSNQLVIGPDHRGGCWLIGLHTADRARLHRIRRQQKPEADELLARFDSAAVALLERKLDLDHTGDLTILARLFVLPTPLFPSIPDSRDIARHGALHFIQRFVQIPPPVVLPAA